MVTPATVERRRFADELLAVGPDAPTLCGTWTTRDLAAHIVVRDSRPDALPGVAIPAFAGYTERVQRGVAQREWEALVDTVRNGPPTLSPVRIDVVDRFVNTSEFFVHHEDVRRAGDDWSPRQLDPELVDELYGVLRRTAKLLVRKAPAGITLTPDDGRDPIVAKKAEPMVTVSGAVGELVMWIFGRQAHSVVGYVGPDAAVDALRHTSFGI
jgi:uncharacterized protein (TIGR03085 family)